MAAAGDRSTTYQPPGSSPNREAEKRTEILRQEPAVAIRQADADDLPQKDICEATGYTRQQVRRIVLAGNEPDAGES